MSYFIDIQPASENKIPFSGEILENWAIAALKEAKIESAELTLRLVDEEEIQHLNLSYRKKDKPTNVLAFPSSLPEDIELEYPFLGDVIICVKVLEKESEEYSRTLEAHWAHIVTHGVLHLLGYDHIEEEDAKLMQALEIKLLANLGFANPYELEDDNLE